MVILLKNGQKQICNMDKIKYATVRNGDLKEFPLNSQMIVLPDGSEYSLRYDPIRKGLVVTKIYGAPDDNGGIIIQPMVSNQILIK